MDELELRSALDRVGDGVTADELESATLDFKRVPDSPKATYNLLADALVCFANAHGGSVVLGVDDRATTREAAFVGVSDSYDVDLVRKGIFDRTRPPLTPFVTERFVDDVRLLVVSVPQGVMPHSNASGLSTRRLGKECLPFPPDQQREVMIARGQYDWSAERSVVTPAELSAPELGRMRALLTAAGEDHLAELSDVSLLLALRLVTQDGFMTNAGVVLLGDESLIPGIVPDYGYSYQYRPTMGSEASGRMRGARPLLAAIEALDDAVTARSEVHPLNVAGGIQLQIADYPRYAVRELIINALIHRSYEAGGTVDVEHAPEQLAITSPGGLVAGVTPSNILTHPSTPRNRLLTETVAKLQLAERTGQGIDRAYREMLRSGKEPPTIEDVGAVVRAVMPGGVGNTNFVRFVSDLPAKAARDVNVLLALSYLRHHARIDMRILANVIQRPAGEAQVVLTAMTTEYHLIEPTRRTATRSNPSYRLRSETIAAMSRAVHYHRVSVDDVDQKIVDHVREYGFITNRTVQRLFDVHVYAARDLLNRLREQGSIAKMGEARGGRGVRYGPGPRFPR